jgi:hypothetical protein
MSTFEFEYFLDRPLNHVDLLHSLLQILLARCLFLLFVLETFLGPFVVFLFELLIEGFLFDL